MQSRNPFKILNKTKVAFLKNWIFWIPFRKWLYSFINLNFGTARWYTLKVDRVCQQRVAKKLFYIPNYLRLYILDDNLKPIKRLFWRKIDKNIPCKHIFVVKMILALSKKYLCRSWFSEAVCSQNNPIFFTRWLKRKTVFELPTTFKIGNCQKLWRMSKKKVIENWDLSKNFQLFFDFVPIFFFSFFLRSKMARHRDVRNLDADDYDDDYDYGKTKFRKKIFFDDMNCLHCIYCNINNFPFSIFGRSMGFFVIGF